MAEAMRAKGIERPTFTRNELVDIIAFITATANDPGGETAQVLPGTPQGGETLFRGKQCAVCHTIGGKGGKVGPELGRAHHVSLTQFAGLMWNHSPVMAAEAVRSGIPPVTFSGQEMADIIAYLYFINYATVTGTPDRGAVIFKDRCSICHDIGEGARVGPDLATAPGLDEPLAIIATMWNHAQKMEQELRRLGRAWPRFARPRPPTWRHAARASPRRQDGIASAPGSVRPFRRRRCRAADARHLNSASPPYGCAPRGVPAPPDRNVRVNSMTGVPSGSRPSSGWTMPAFGRDRSHISGTSLRA
jgi:cytochrome c2